MTCKHCNKAIEGRVDKVFCSVLCRKKEWRGTANGTTSPENGTTNPENGTASGTLSPIAVPNGTTSGTDNGLTGTANGTNGTAIGTDSGTANVPDGTANGPVTSFPKTPCAHTGECLSREDWQGIFKENMSANYYSKACPSSYELVEKPLEIEKETIRLR